MLEAKKHTDGDVAFYYWFPHVTIVDPKAIIDGMEWDYDQAALRGSKETQSTRIASLAIRDPNLTPLLYIEVHFSHFSV